MAGTTQGGRLAAQKNKQRHGADFYARIGRLGGRRGHSGGFAAGPEGRKRASYYGAKGGSLSRRPSKKLFQ
jgi:general stress protein YciG